MQGTVGELVALLEKLPANAEVSVLTRDATGIGSEFSFMEDLDLTPVKDARPDLYSADNVMCLSTKHVTVIDTRHIHGMAPLNRKVTVKIGGELS